MDCSTWACRALGAFAIAALSAPPALAQVTTTFTYDAQGQVRSVARPAQTVTYAYDAAANRTQMTSTAPLAGRTGAETSVGTASPSSADRVAPPSPPIPATPPLPPFPSPPPPPVSPLSSATPGAPANTSVAR